MKPEVSVLFACLGNICRSPTADGVLKAKVAAAGLSARVAVDSAGTGDWHVGCAPDARAQAAAEVRGISIADLRARPVSPADLRRFDYVIAMDQGNYDDLCTLAADHGMALDRIELFTDLVAPSVEAPEAGVPDPYAGGADGFRRVVEIIEAGADTLMARISARLAHG